MKRNLIKRPSRGLAALTLALFAALAAVETAQAAYWNRSRNRRGSSDDAGGNSASPSADDNSSSGGNRRGRDLDADGIPNISDPDIDNDGVPNGEDSNVDGGVSLSGKYRGRYVGDRLPNSHPGEKDTDDDGLDNDSAAELDIDGDGLADDSADETDIDGDGKSDDAADELDIDGDGKADDAANEFDIDGDGKSNASDDDIDGDGVLNADDSDDDGDGTADADDTTPSGSTPPATTPPGGGSSGGQVGDGNAPAALTGIVYEVRQSNGQLEASLNFSGAAAGNETDPAGDNDPFSYTYTANGTTASLKLQFKSDKWDEYDLNYATGTYARREFDRNALKDTDTGKFNLAGATPPPPPPPSGTGNGGPVGDGTAPASVDGLTWIVSEMNGHVEASLVFSSATAGSENDPDGDVDPFTCTYTANGATATLRLDFKPGKWDEYDLNFATGLYTRREFKNNALDDTDTGFFGLTAPTPPPVTPPPAGNDDGTPDQGSGDL